MKPLKLEEEFSFIAPFCLIPKSKKKKEQMKKSSSLNLKRPCLSNTCRKWCTEPQGDKIPPISPMTENGVHMFFSLSQNCGILFLNYNFCSSNIFFKDNFVPLQNKRKREQKIEPALKTGFCLFT